MEDMNKNAIAVGTDYSNRVKDKVDFNFTQLEGLAAFPVFQHPDENKDQIIAALAELKNRSDMFEGVFCIRLDGSGYNNANSNTNIGDRDFFKKVLATKQKVLSDPIISKTTGKLSVVFAVPILQNQQVVGLITGTVLMEKLSASMDTMKFLQTGYGQLSDNSGILIAHPQKPELVGKLNLMEKKINPELGLQATELDDHLISLMQQAVQSDAQSLGTYTFIDQIKRIAVMTPIDLPGGQRWILTVAAPESEGLAAVYHLSWSMLAASVFCMLLAIFAILFIARQFTKPIELLRDECMLLANGDFRTHAVALQREDELGQLYTGFEKMRDNLQKLIGKIRLQMEQLAASSEELTASAEQSAQSTTQVADSIANIAAQTENQKTAANESTIAVEQMSAGLQQVAATSTQVADQSTQMAQNANEGNQAIGKAIVQMTQIEKTVDSSSKVVKKLGTRSSEIGQIVTTISDIASQTNLLALNAAIEAARAGEAGRGFAVVAEEVRKLAEQSQNATGQIAQLIKDIQEETQQAVIAMDSGSEEVKAGSQVVNKAGKAFEEILAAVTNSTGQIKEISLAIDHIANNSEKIVTSVKQMDTLSKKTEEHTQSVSSATQEQAASAESIASASKELATLATGLQDAIHKFRVS